MTGLPDLARLKHLSDIFGTLIRGRHINRLQDAAWWSELDIERDTYVALFTQLGFSLEVDPRGFAWFQNEEPAANIGVKTRNLALLLLALFERQADKGFNLTRFYEWLIDEALLDELLERHAQMLEAEDLCTRDHLVTTLGSGVSYGFVSQEAPGRWRLLEAAWRYMDSFEAIAVSQDTGALDEEDDG